MSARRTAEQAGLPQSIRVGALGKLDIVGKCVTPSGRHAVVRTVWFPNLGYYTGAWPVCGECRGTMLDGEHVCLAAEYVQFRRQTHVADEAISNHFYALRRLGEAEHTAVDPRTPTEATP